jgi:ABC-type transporter Mla subunit MlaD
MSEQYGPPRGEGPPPPRSLEGAAPDISAQAAQTRQLVQALENALRDSMADLRKDVGEIKARSHADYHRLLYIFGAGVAALVAVFGWGYNRLDDRLIAVGDKITDRAAIISTDLARIDQKLDDLIARIPPVPTPPPHR